MVFQASEVVTPEDPGTSAGGAIAGREIKTDAEEGGFLGGKGSYWGRRGGVVSCDGGGFGLGEILREDGCAGTVTEREKLFEESWG